MKNSIWYLSLALLSSLGLANTFSTHAYGQSSGAAPQTSPGQGSPTVSCGSAPCPQTGGQGSISNGGKRYTPPPPKTEEQKEKIEKQGRYDDLFSQLEAQERLAKSYEDAGDASNAVSWRADFARKSGLTPEEAEIVKRIGVQFRKDRETLSANYYAAIAAAHAQHIKPQDSPDFVDVKQKRDTLFPKTMADLLTALGSKSFTRLDGYTRHMHDNDRVLYRTPDKPNGGAK